jgi:hypothetical protein
MRPSFIAPSAFSPLSSAGAKSAARVKRLACILGFSLILAACGGGGGGGSSAPPNTAPVANAGSAQTVLPGATVTLSGSASSDANGDPLTYSWSLTSKPVGSTAALSSSTGVSPTFVADRAGTYQASLTVNDGKVSSSASTVSILANTPPTAVISPNTTTTLVGVAKTFSASSSVDADGDTLTYSWTLTSRPGGSTAVLSSATAVSTNLTADLPGSYVLQLTTNDGKASTSSTLSLTASYGPPGTPTVSVNSNVGTVGQNFSFSASATDPRGLALSYSWNFGDGSSGAGAQVTHAYANTGTYTVTATATNSENFSSSATLTVTVASSVVSTLAVDCSGANCGASDASTYAGSGVGVWRYQNTGTDPAAVNVDINNVQAGKSVTLVMSNGSVSNVGSAGAWGTVGPTASPLQASNAPLSLAALELRAQISAMKPHDHAHGRINERNRAAAAQVRGWMPQRSTPAAIAPPARPSAATVVGATRTWKDTYASTSSPTLYPSTAKAVCTSTNGRTIVIWADTTAFTAGSITQSQVDSLATSFCGTTGGLARLMTLMGDVWGTHSYPTQLISDATKQEVHVALINDQTDAGWAGYFWGRNNFIASQATNSNEALVFFIASKYLTSSPRFVASALIHEAAHMINFYQRAVVRDTDHDSWLEETSAMMAEDIVSPAVVKNADTSAYNPMSGRVSQYMSAGGGKSYINWPDIGDAGPHYGMGGSFGAFLNRRFGSTIAEQLVTNCQDGSVANDSYTCLDAIIKSAGGPGFDVEFAHFGSSIFSTLPATAIPAGYGLPAVSSFLAIDINNLKSSLPSVPTSLGASSFPASSHYYRADVQSATGKYTRTGIVVPPGVTLQVIIR